MGTAVAKQPMTPKEIQEHEDAEFGTFNGAVLRAGFSLFTGGPKPIIGDGKRKVSLDRDTARKNIHKFDNVEAIRKHFKLGDVEIFAQPPSRADRERMAQESLKSNRDNKGGGSISAVAIQEAVTAGILAAAPAIAAAAAKAATEAVMGVTVTEPESGTGPVPTMPTGPLPTGPKAK